MRRLKKQLLPRVHGSKINKGYGFVELDEAYEALPKSHLKITAKMGAPTVVSGAAIHFDSALSSAVLTAHPCSCKYDEYALVPLPLDILYMHNDLPLWAASDFISDKVITSSEYWHKRYPSDRVGFASKRNANTSAGRWREYRMPLNLNATHQFEAYAIGNADEVERILSYIKFIGKKNSYGYGRVLKWTVDEVDNCIDEIHNNKPLPKAYADAQGISGKLLPAESFTSPYWYKPHQTECIDVRR